MSRWQLATHSHFYSSTKIKLFEYKSIEQGSHLLGSVCKLQERAWAKKNEKQRTSWKYICYSMFSIFGSEMHSYSPLPIQWDKRNGINTGIWVIWNPGASCHMPFCILFLNYFRKQQTSAVSIVTLLYGRNVAMEPMPGTEETGKTPKAQLLLWELNLPHTLLVACKPLINI